MVISHSIYDLMITLALVFNILFIVFNYRKYNLKFRDVILLLLIENIFIVLGGKFFTFLDEFPKYGFKEILDLWFTSYGNMIGAFIGIIVYSLIFKKDMTALLTLGGLPLPMVYAIGKIGCFTAGCCYGINYAGFGKVIYTSSNQAPLNVSLFPIQLVEALIFAGIFFYFYHKCEKKRKTNRLSLNDTFFLLIAISISKFGLDYLRSSSNNAFLSFNQKISIVLFIVGILGLGYSYVKVKKKDIIKSRN